MGDGFFKVLNESASLVGASDAKWLREEREPEFITVEPNAAAPLPGVPGVVLLHGLFGALSNWDSLLPLLSEFTNPAALSFPILTGHRSEVKVKALALLTEFFIRKRNLQPVCLCGNSMGGHVALRLALARPELVDCLILSGASGLYEHTVDALPVRPDDKYLREHMARVFYDHRFITDQAVNEILQILSGRGRHLNLIHAARSAKKDNLQEVLGNITVPTLLLWGEDDEVTTMNVAETFHRLIPGSELITIKNCGHAPMIERPEWFAEQINIFLKKHSRVYKSQNCCL